MASRQLRVQYGLFVSGVSMALLCVSVFVLTQVFKVALTPAIVYYLLAIPPASFLLYYGYHRQRGISDAGLRDAVAGLLAGLLLCYLLPYLLRWLLFPEYTPNFAYYHHYALPALITALCLIRFHACGEHRFALLFGTAAGLIAFFFLLTAFPLLSPVYYPIINALAGLVFLSFLGMLKIRQEMFLKTIFVRLAGIDDADWNRLKRFTWAILLLGCLLLFLAAIFHPIHQPLTLNRLLDLLAREGSAARDPMLPQSSFFIGLALVACGLTAAFFVFERTFQQDFYQQLTPLLWLHAALLAVYSPCLLSIFYQGGEAFWRVQFQILIWAVSSILLGRFLSIGWLWLWGSALLYPAALLAVFGADIWTLVWHPLALACAAIGLAGFSSVVSRWKCLFEGRYPAAWVTHTGMRPEFLFSAASQVIVYLIFLRAASEPALHTSWLMLAGLFLTPISALLVRHTLWTSRHTLFFTPYAMAWIGLCLSLKLHLPDHPVVMALEAPHLLACGLFIALLTAVLSDLLRPCQEIGYLALRSMSAGGILLLIFSVYLFQTRDLTGIAGSRFLISGILTLGSGLYFRFLIDDRHKDRCYALFASGLTISLICFGTFLFRDVSGFSLNARAVFGILALPPLWFYLRSEYNRAANRLYAAGRDATANLLCYLLAFYAFPTLIRFLLLPTYAPGFFHYSQHAIVALLVGSFMIRLHALGGGSWLVFTGMHAFVAALFFLTIRLPVLILGTLPVQSPGQTFAFFTWSAVALSYLFFSTTGPRGPLKIALTTLGRIDDALWRTVRLSLFPVLLVAAHLLFLGSVSLSVPAQYADIGLLLLALAGLWIFLGTHFRNTLFYSLAYLEIVAAIFSCRVYPAVWWNEQWIIWLLLGLFLLLIPIYELGLHSASLMTRSGRTFRYAQGNYYAWLLITAGLVISEHVTFYGLHSNLGITPLLVLWGITLFLPVSSAIRSNRFFQGVLGLLLYAPAIFFFLAQGLPSLEQIPRVALAAVLISCGLIAYRIAEWNWFSDEDVRQFRVLHHLHWYCMQPHSLLLVFLFATAAVISTHGLSYFIDPHLFQQQFYSLLLVQIILAVYWFDLARKDRAWWWTVTAEAMIAGSILTLRQGLPLRFHLPWTLNWDMMIGWCAALTITATAPLLKRQHTAVRRPIRFTLFGLPIVTVMYALDYNVSFDALARMLLLYSVLFIWQAYSEKDRLVLAYAFLGINSYLILYLLHHDIQSLQAYITPVCLSILVLTQVFRGITSPTTANLVRGVTLLILLGMSMFEAIARHSTSPWAHLIVLTLSFLAIVAAVGLRIRIFAVMGLLSFFVDLIAIVYIVLSQQDTETLKVLLGLGLTLGGGMILGGYIMYRKHQAAIQQTLAAMKRAFSSWE